MTTFQVEIYLPNNLQMTTPDDTFTVQSDDVYSPPIRDIVARMQLEDGEIVSGGAYYGAGYDRPVAQWVFSTDDMRYVAVVTPIEGGAL